MGKIIKQYNKGYFENLAKTFLWIALIITIIATILFLINRQFSFSLPIANDVYGQYGDFIGGIVGTMVSLISFLLLYETLNEQRRIFQKQNEDNIFFRVLEKQQNRIINSSLTIGTNKFIGYEIFSGLSNEISIQLTNASLNLARQLICEKPEDLDHLFFQKLFSTQYNYDLDKLDEFTEQYMQTVKDMDFNRRWEYNKTYFGSIGTESEGIKQALLSVGQVKFYKIEFFKRQEIIDSIFSELLANYGYFLDGYFKELEYIGNFINKSQNYVEFNSYFLSQITQYEYVLIFNYLISNSVSNDFVNYCISSKLIEDLKKCRTFLFDYPTIDEMDNEIKNIRNMIEQNAAR